MTKAGTPDGEWGELPPFLADLSAGTGRLSIPVWGCRELEPDWGFRNRTVAAHVVYAVVSGGLRCRDGLHEHRVADGGMLWIPPGVVHDLAMTERPTRAYYMRVVWEGTPWPVAPRVRVSRSRMARRHFDAMAPLVGGGFPSGRPPWRLACLLGLVFGEFSGPTGPESPGSAAKHPGLARAMGWATTAEVQDLTVKDLAREADLGGDRLGRVMAREMGVSPRLWLVRERLRRAKGLLEETREPVGRVARLCGWENPLLFSRLFRKAFGVSPRGWRGG